MTKAVGPYSPLIQTGDWLIISGQVGIKNGKLVDTKVGSLPKNMLESWLDSNL